jgi:hypothetical protein
MIPVILIMQGGGRVMASEGWPVGSAEWFAARDASKPTAKPVEAIVVLIDTVVDGVRCVGVTCRNYAEFKALPNAVDCGGQVLGKSAWSSDTYRAYFQSNVPVAYPVKSRRTR